jgi:hypothetical protein
MNQNGCWLGLLTIALIAANAPAQVDPKTGPDRRATQTALPDAGFWPTPAILDWAIEEFTDRLGRDLDFDEDQLYQTRQVWKETLPTFLKSNRAEIQSLTNWFLEARLAKQPPSAEQVAAWAERALPLMDQFQELVETNSDRMHEFLTEDQTVVFEGHRAAARVALDLTTKRVRGWEQGGFEPERDWRPVNNPPTDELTKRELRELQHQMAQAQQTAVERFGGAKAKNRAAQPAPPKQQKDDWAAYVKRFVAAHQLNPDQQATANKILKALQERRDNYVSRNSGRLKQLEQRYRRADTPKALKQAEAEHKKFKSSIDRMFQQLKERLRRLPTRKQRQTAREAGWTEDAKTTDKGERAGRGPSVKP